MKSKLGQKFLKSFDEVILNYKDYLITLKINNSTINLNGSEKIEEKNT